MSALPSERRSANPASDSIRDRPRSHPSNAAQTDEPASNGQGFHDRPPPRAASEAPQSRAGRDLIVAIALVVGGGAFFVASDSVEHVLPMLVRWEKAQLDDLLLTLWLAVSVTGWFGLRRWRDCARQNRALRDTAAERALYLSRLEQLSTQLLDAEEQERARIAELLHDEIGQSLYACRLRLEMLSERVCEPDASRLLADASQLASEAMDDARELARQLHPPELDDLDLAEAIAAIGPSLGQRFALHIEVVPSSAFQDIPRRYYGPIFASIKELIHNAAKHAGAASVRVSATRDPARGVTLLVEDDGEGFPREPAARLGFGLISVERRMAWMNGRLEIEARPGGTAAMLCFHV